MVTSLANVSDTSHCSFRNMLSILLQQAASCAYMPRQAHVCRCNSRPELPFFVWDINAAITYPLMSLRVASLHSLSNSLSDACMASTLSWLKQAFISGRCSSRSDCCGGVSFSYSVNLVSRVALSVNRSHQHTLTISKC